MSTSLSTRLEALMLTSEAADYAAAGFHQTHTAETAKLPDVAEAFLQAGYILEMLTCQDLREEVQAMRLVYTFNSLASVDRHLVHADLDPDSEEAPTLSSIIGGANWFEREVYEMYGVRFTDHPYLVQLLLPEDADFFALRKDFGRIEDAEEDDEDE